MSFAIDALNIERHEVVSMEGRGGTRTLETIGRKTVCLNPCVSYAE